MKRLLSIATLYPNAHQPRFGPFVARQLEALAARGDWDVTVVNPIGVPPLALGRYKPLAEAAVTGVEHGVTVHRPRFTLVPRLGGPVNPAMIARAVLPLARRLREGDSGAGLVLAAMTGWGEERDRQRAREAGFDHHFSKPADIRMLGTLLDDVRRNR